MCCPLKRFNLFFPFEQNLCHLHLFCFRVMCMFGEVMGGKVHVS